MAGPCPDAVDCGDRLWNQLFATQFNTMFAAASSTWEELHDKYLELGVDGLTEVAKQLSSDWHAFCMLEQFTFEDACAPANLRTKTVDTFLHVCRAGGPNRPLHFLLWEKHLQYDLPVKLEEHLAGLNLDVETRQARLRVVGSLGPLRHEVGYTDNLDDYEGWELCNRVDALQRELAALEQERDVIVL